MDQKSLVSDHAPGGYMCRSVAVMVGADMSTHSMGDDVTFQRRGCRVCRHLHFILAANFVVLSGAGLGICSVLYNLRSGRDCQLVSGAAPPVQ